MIIYSWNMLFENENLEEAFDFVKETDFDIFCFQEVPEEFLSRLQTLPYDIAHHSEGNLKTKSQSFSVYCVIVSKHLIVNSGAINFPNPKKSLREKITRFLMNKLRKKEPVIAWGGRSSLFADISFGEKTIRVFSLHLALSTPVQRMTELSLAMKYKTDFSVVCGDFNILETFYISLLNFLLGGSLFDWLFYKKERRAIEKYFSELGLENPLRGHSTHPISRSQLDHILIPERSQIISKALIKNRYGSDHCPISVELK